VSGRPVARQALGVDFQPETNGLGILCPKLEKPENMRVR